MSDIKNEHEKARLLLDHIAANPDTYGTLEEKKITPALLAFQCVSLENLAHSVNKLATTMDNMLKFLHRKGGVFYQEGGGV
jgi:hypothetical protein